MHSVTQLLLKAQVYKFGHLPCRFRCLPTNLSPLSSLGTLQTERELTKVLWHLCLQPDYSLLTDDILHFIYLEEIGENVRPIHPSPFSLPDWTGLDWIAGSFFVPQGSGSPSLGASSAAEESSSVSSQSPAIPPTRSSLRIPTPILGGSNQNRSSSTMDMIDLLFYCFSREETDVLRLAHNAFSRLWRSCGTLPPSTSGLTVINASLCLLG